MAFAAIPMRNARRRASEACSISTSCWRGQNEVTGHRMDDSVRRHDKALGIDAAMTRRDFLNSTLIASGALLTPRTPAEILAKAVAQGDEWTGFAGVGD